MKDFSKDKFPVFACTMALGLGQNWKRVRTVVHMGCGDPSTISQMIGHCGHDGRAGLAILFVEPKRMNRKNDVSDFASGRRQLDGDNRMDTFAVTLLCLRVVAAVDNMYVHLPLVFTLKKYIKHDNDCRNGYIPVLEDDSNYQTEKRQQEHLKFDCCLCSNCNPKAAQKILNRVRLFNHNNFDNILNNPKIYSFDESESAQAIPKKKRKANKPTSKFSSEVVEKMAGNLVEEVESFYRQLVGSNTKTSSWVFFGLVQAKYAVHAFDQIHEPGLLSRTIGGEWFDGQIDHLLEFIDNYIKSNWFKECLFELGDNEKSWLAEKEKKQTQKKQLQLKKENKKQKKEDAKQQKKAQDAI
jgi:superfamily II DNA/RNA helicase